jgi:hypothetical protein
MVPRLLGQQLSGSHADQLRLGGLDPEAKRQKQRGTVHLLRSRFLSKTDPKKKRQVVYKYIIYIYILYI